MRKLFAPALESIGTASKPQDSDNEREGRSTLVRLLGDHAGDPAVAADARRMLDASLAGHAPLDPTVAGAIVRVAAAHGDAALFDALKAAAARTSSPDEHYRYLYALASFPEPALIDRGLELARSRDMRSQDAAIYISQFFGNPAARDRAWSFVKAHWAELEPKITISGGDTNLVTSLSAFCDAETRDDIRAFFATHKLPTASRALAQTMERIANCVELKKTQTPVLDRWIESASSR